MAPVTQSNKGQSQVEDKPAVRLINTQKPAHSSTDAVLGTQELLELMLAKVDVQTLLLSQRVSRHWHETITTSPELQRALFFLPIKAESVEHLTQLRVRNPLLEKVFAAWFRDTGDYSAANPFLEAFGGAETDAAKGPIEKEAWRRRQRAMTRRGASWRRMLVQQPACSKLGFIQHDDRFSGQESYARAVLSFPLTPSPSGNPPGGGLRMATLYDLMYRFMGQRLRHDLGHRVLWRVPAEEPPLSQWRFIESGCTDVLQHYMTPEVGIVVIQQGKMFGFEPVRDGVVNPIGDREMVFAQLRHEWLCEEFHLPEMRLQLVMSQTFVYN